MLWIQISKCTKYIIIHSKFFNRITEEGFDCWILEYLFWTSYSFYGRLMDIICDIFSRGSTILLPLSLKNFILSSGINLSIKLHINIVAPKPKQIIHYSKVNPSLWQLISSPPNSTIRTCIKTIVQTIPTNIVDWFIFVKINFSYQNLFQLSIQNSEGRRHLLEQKCCKYFY